MKIQNYNTNNNTHFSALTKTQLNRLAQIIEARNPEYAKKNPNAAKIYKDGIDFLKGKIDKKDYLNKLNNTIKNCSLKNLKTPNALSKKERVFLENFSISIDNSKGFNKFTKDQIANHLAILA